MSENEKQLGPDEMKRLLGLLDEELRRRGQSATIYLVGGANIALTVNTSRTTTDIDVVVKEGFEYLADAAKAVANREDGLAADWINTEFTGGTPDGGITWQWFDNKGQDEAQVLFSSDALTVELASKEMMLALKTLAGRDQDLQDTYDLMRATGIREPEGLFENLKSFTGPRLFESQGEPGMFINVSPNFRRIIDHAPEDLKPTRKLSFREHRAARADCPVVRQRIRSGVVLSQARCRKKEGHFGPHRFG